MTNPYRGNCEVHRWKGHKDEECPVCVLHGPPETPTVNEDMLKNNINHILGVRFGEPTAEEFFTEEQPDDKIFVKIGSEDGSVKMAFPTPTSWIMFSPEQTLQIVELLLLQALKCGLDNEAAKEFLARRT